MLSYEEALALIKAEAGRVVKKVEAVDYRKSLNRVLAGPVRARFDLPRFNNSAVDGYGVLVEDIAMASDNSPVTLKLDGEVAAGGVGNLSAHTGDSGHCVRILTGAIVPDHVEAVVMKEFCTLSKGSSEDSGSVSVSAPVKIGENIRVQGEEVEAGASVLSAGLKISPPIVGLLATLGETSVKVFTQPRFAVVATGDELVEPGQPLNESQIYNSNSHAMTAALEALGIPDTNSYLARDNEEETKKILAEALAKSDVVISIGGVSVGEHDYVKKSFEDLGVKTIFWRVAVKPGKPVYFGIIEDAEQKTVEKLIFGLPGNPVSALVTFNLFVKPALKIIQGLKEKRERITTARLARRLNKKAGRLDFVRGTLETADDGSLVAAATTGQESHMLTGLAAADCLMLFGKELDFLAEGATLPVQALNWHE